MSRFTALAAAAATVALLGGVHPALQAQTDVSLGDGPRPAEQLAKRATPEQLKTAFLECDRLSQTVPLDFGTAAQCSVVYEALKQRVFDGDFERLLVWWRVEAKRAVAQGPAPMDP
jgi:hypothetical protein